jgi:predicted LPLAT superfamily acyltransferase
LELGHCRPEQEGARAVYGPEQEGRTKEKKRGNELGLWFFMAFLRLFGLRGAYGLLYIVCLYYVLFDRSLVSSAMPYINRRFPDCGFLGERLHAYRLFVSQGKQLIDRYAALSGHEAFDFELRGHEEFVSLIRDSKRGAILLASHQGNWQVAMTALEKIGKPVHLVMLPDENPALQSKLYPVPKAGNIRIISPQQYLGGVVEIVDALRKGDVVSIMGDRRYGGRALEVSFLGDKAWFPYSAFSLAASAECPVVVLRAFKASAHRYVIDVTNVMHPRCEERRNRVRQLQPWVQEFVKLLESFVEEYPYQCFLFHDVWKEEAEGAAA